MVGQTDYTTGQYSLNASTPSGGTWTSRYTLIDTQVDETEQTMYVWQKQQQQVQRLIITSLVKQKEQTELKK